MRARLEPNYLARFGYVRALHIYDGPLELAWVDPRIIVKPFIEGSCLNPGKGRPLGDEIRREIRKMIFFLRGLLGEPLHGEFNIAGWDY